MHPDLNEAGEDEVSPMAFVLADMPEVWQRLLEDHVPNSSGRCQACRNHGTAGVPWPCTLQVIAADARAIHQSPSVAVAGEFTGPVLIDADAARCGLAC